MIFACLLGRHEARASAVRNHGLYFSACLHCRCDMVRSLGHWRRVPKGFRVVWRNAGVSGPIAANLPVPMPPTGPNGPAVEMASRLTALAAMAFAGLRALGWDLRDRLGAWRRRGVLRRRPVLLRLSTP